MSRGKARRGSLGESPGEHRVEGFDSAIVGVEKDLKDLKFFEYFPYFGKLCSNAVVFSLALRVFDYGSSACLALAGVVED